MAVITDEKKIDELLSQGVEEIFVKEHLREALMSGRELRVKLGFDPTGAKIHLGRAIVLRKLRAFQELGHRAVFIVGDFTGVIGDPSDKLGKRPMLSVEEIKANVANYKRQVGKIIDLRRAEFYYNSRWLRKLRFDEIARLAESFSVQQMVARRNFKERWDREEEISLREFLYPLMQGYDSVVVKADIEIGGFDQLFNLKAGRIIQKHYGMPEQDILTTVMLEGLDGRKMSTSWGNVVNIVDEPNDMFGKIMSLNDNLVAKYFQLCTELPGNEIQTILTLGPRDAKMRLAFEIVRIYHSRAAAKRAKDYFVSVFSEKRRPEEIPTRVIGRTEIELIELLKETGLALSKSEARRLVEQGGVSVDGVRQSNPTAVVRIAAEGSIIQVGPRRFLKVTP